MNDTQSQLILNIAAVAVFTPLAALAVWAAFTNPFHWLTAAVCALFAGLSLIEGGEKGVLGLLTAIKNRKGKVVRPKGENAAERKQMPLKRI